jgi:uncharacterized protein (TIGR02996 family)
MNQEEALLQAFTENPADEVCRQVYADWLEDQGEEVSIDLRRPDGIITVWPDGLVFWRLNAEQRTWLLGRLAGPLPRCGRCGHLVGLPFWSPVARVWSCVNCRFQDSLANDRDAVS